VTDSDADPSTTEAPDSLAAAEEELVRAEERAAAARARAAELRREAGSSEQSEPTEDADVVEAKPAASRSRRRWPWRLRRPTRNAVGVSTAIVLITASLAASGYFVWQHRNLVERQQHAAEFVAAAREEVAAMMSIDPAHAAENIQHTIDDATGLLKSQLEVTSTYVVKNAQDARITTKATVEDVAVESMSDNSAVVLVVTKSETINADKSKRPTVFWRLSVNIDRDGDRLKMSKIDFVK
jgi:Mce-associated membrane protein